MSQPLHIRRPSVVEWTYVPGEPTEEKFIKAILDTDKAGKEFLAKRI